MVKAGFVVLLSERLPAVNDTGNKVSVHVFLLKNQRHSLSSKL